MSLQTEKFPKSTKKYPDTVKLLNGSVFKIDERPELNGQHLPEIGSKSGSPVFINWHNRIVYCSIRRTDENTIVVLESGDRGY